MKFPGPLSDSLPLMDLLKQILNYLRASRVLSINGVTGQESPNGTRFNIPVGGPTGGGSGGPTVCAFGELETWTEDEETKTGIRGGIVYCGDKNFNVGRHELDLEVEGVWLIYLQISCEVNRDDDNEIILPGIKTSAETDPADFWKSDAWTVGPPETQYPPNVNPTVADGLGTNNIPLGKLTIAEGVATFAKAGCGNVRMSQCGGTLAHDPR